MSLNISNDPKQEKDLDQNQPETVQVDVETEPVSLETPNQSSSDDETKASHSNVDTQSEIETEVVTPPEEEESKNEKSKTKTTTKRTTKKKDVVELETAVVELVVEQSTDQPNEHDFSLELIDQTMSSVSSGQIVNGTVVSVDDKDVLVDIGCKSESAISINEFSSDQIPVKGDVISVYVVSRESADGKPVLSKKKADFFTNLNKIKDAFQNDEIITGKLTKKVKGGMIVEILGVEAFIPSSQIALKNVINLDQFVNKEVSLKIIKLDEGKKNIVVSRRVVLESELESQRLRLKELLNVGTELDGEVKNVTDFGAFVDLGGIHGLLHITDMSWGKINHPSEILNIGDKIKVKVLGFDNEVNKISLGIKQLVPHPWENIEAKYPEGTKVTGKVINLTKYGAFVEIEPGVEGLIHVTEMSWTKNVRHPRHVLKVGEIVSAIVLVVSKENQRISLGLKQMQLNPWISIENRYPIGTIIKKQVKSFTDFGAFVEIEPDIDGLVHISDMSWTRRINHPKEALGKGQEVEAVILAVDKLLHRIALGVKQLQVDPWVNLVDEMPVNTEVVGKLVKYMPKGLIVDIPFKDTLIEGFVPISHIALPLAKCNEDAFEKGEELNMKIIEIDTETRRVILSIKAWYFSREKKLMQEYQKIHLDNIIKNKEIRQAQQEKREKNKAKAKAKAEARAIAKGDTIVNTSVEEAVEKVKDSQVEVTTPVQNEVVTQVEQVVEDTTARTESIIEDDVVHVEPIVEDIVKNEETTTEIE